MLFSCFKLLTTYTDHPTVTRITQPSTMVGSMGDPGFSTLDSTAITQIKSSVVVTSNVTHFSTLSYWSQFNQCNVFLPILFFLTFLKSTFANIHIECQYHVNFLEYDHVVAAWPTFSTSSSSSSCRFAIPQLTWHISTTSRSSWGCSIRNRSLHDWWWHWQENSYWGMSSIIVNATSTTSTSRQIWGTVQGPVLLTFLRHVARISANGIAAFKESCSPIG